MRELSISRQFSNLYQDQYTLLIFVPSILVPFVMADDNANQREFIAQKYKEIVEWSAKTLEAINKTPWYNVRYSVVYALFIAFLWLLHAYTYYTCSGDYVYSCLNTPGEWSSSASAAVSVSHFRGRTMLALFFLVLGVVSVNGLSISLINDRRNKVLGVSQRSSLRAQSYAHGAPITGGEMAEIQEWLDLLAKADRENHA